MVGIGASAGGLDPLQQFVKTIPPGAGLSYLIVQHLDPTRRSETPGLLQRNSSVPVITAEDRMPVEPDHVYVIPPDRYMVVEQGILRLSSPPEPRGLRLPIDALFNSMASELGERAVGIVLSGTGADGSLGLRAVKGNGGMAVVQDPATAEFDGMPRSAISTGVVDFVLPVPRMMETIRGYVTHHYVQRSAEGTGRTPDFLSGILALLMARRNMDFNSYKKGTLLRRVERRMGLRQIDAGVDYLHLLRDDPDELSALFNDLLIQVTRFFREPEAWQHLISEAIPAVIDQADRDNPIRVWIPACATGEEAYSMAILLLEAREKTQKALPIQVFASDLDRVGLDLARNGVFPESIAADLSPERLGRFFNKGENNYTVSQQLRDSVVFAQHNLLADPPFSRLDIISCRNLLIYLEPPMQRRVIDRFHFGLKPGRFLFLGTSETIGDQTDLFQPVSKRSHLYRRLGTTRHDRLRLSMLPVRTEEAPAPMATMIGVRDGAALARAREIVLERYTAASALVNQKFEILSLFGPTQKYLLQPTGLLTPDILGWVRDGTRSKLRTALQSAVRKNEPVSVQGLRIRQGDSYLSASCTVEPLSGSPQSDGLLLVVFKEERADLVSPPPARNEAEESLVRQLEYELKIARDELQTSVEQLESSNEELRATNEEVLSMNEELQSANEELETSKEELQSINEELTTVNSQLEAKMGELQEVNDDISNLLISTDIPTIFLNRHLRIRRFTPAITRLFRLIPTDVGRPLADITQLVNDDEVLKDARRVLQTLIPLEVQVKSRDGQVHVRKVLPYRTGDDRIEGVVVIYQDVTDRVRSSELLQDARDYAEAIVDTVREPLVVLDGELRIQSANAAFHRAFKLTHELVGTRIYDLGHGEWNIPGLRNLLEEMLPRQTQFTDFEVRREFAGVGPRVMCLNAKILQTGKQRLILLAIEDITIKAEAENARNEVLRQLVNYEERERHRLALELHDETGQHVTAFLLGLAALKDSYAHQPDRREVIEQLQARAEELAQQLHGISLELRPLALDDHGLERALTNYIEDVSMRHNLEIDFQASGFGLGRVPRHIETVLYRVTQEALTNVIRHARAKKVSVVLARKIREISLIVEDDGDGFDADTVLESLETNGGRLGLRGMRERVMLAGGTLAVESHSLQGAALFVRIPLEGSQPGGPDD